LDWVGVASTSLICCFITSLPPLVSRSNTWIWGSGG
jgi:hypothetical protein